LYTEGETFIGFSAVTADSHSLTDTVDTDSLTVGAVNRCYRRQINWQLLAEQQSECQNAIGIIVEAKKKSSAGNNSSNNTNSTTIFVRFPRIIFRQTNVLNLKFCGQK